MSNDRAPSVFLCNGASTPDDLTESDCAVLDYRSLDAGKPKISLGLPDFVRSVYHLPPRCLDLIEIAAYVFAGDRLTHRGNRIGVEYQSWARHLCFVIRVRDYDFWSKPAIKDKLKLALDFVSGDRAYEFTFQSGHSTPPTSLFDQEHFQVETTERLSIILFSGGLDSLAGAVQRLRETDDLICLVSHQSQGGTIRTQQRLVRALGQAYPGRVSHYQFRTHLQTIRAREESQRTRSFLYGCIAFAIATAFEHDRFFIYENGVTSLNFERREDLLNARASRTTHPQTVGRLASLFSTIAEQPFKIDVPFLWNTKTEVVECLKASDQAQLIPSSVSCSHTFNSQTGATHCGECFQCLDRRIGVYGAAAEEIDNAGLYATDIITTSISSQEGKTTAVDYLRQAANFSHWNQRYFYHRMLDDLQHLLGWVPGCKDEIDLVDKVWDLCSRHGRQVAGALRRMRDIHEEVFKPIAPDSLLKVVSDREFLKEPIERLVNTIQERLASAIPLMFRTVQPKNEADLNDKIEGLLDTWRDDLQREHPAVPFAGAGVVPDFTLDRGHLRIEGKYIRGGTTPSKVTEGMAADLTKYSQEAHIMFVVYDRDRAIGDRGRLKRDFENRGNCTVCILP